jgi:hypothetical protein
MDMGMAIQRRGIHGATTRDVEDHRSSDHSDRSVVVVVDGSVVCVCVATTSHSLRERVPCRGCVAHCHCVGVGRSFGLHFYCHSVAVCSYVVNDYACIPIIIIIIIIIIIVVVVVVR